MALPPGLARKIAETLLRQQAHYRTTTTNMANAMNVGPNNFMRDVPTVQDLLYRARLASSELSLSGGMRAPRKMKNSRSSRHLEQWIMDANEAAGGGRQQKFWDEVVRELESLLSHGDPDSFMDIDDIAY